MRCWRIDGINVVGKSLIILFKIGCHQLKDSKFQFTKYNKQSNTSWTQNSVEPLQYELPKFIFSSTGQLLGWQSLIIKWKVKIDNLSKNINVFSLFFFSSMYLALIWIKRETSQCTHIQRRYLKHIHWRYLIAAQEPILAQRQHFHMYRERDGEDVMRWITLLLNGMAWCSGMNYSGDGLWILLFLPVCRQLRYSQDSTSEF